jgi:multiple sugar transport system ATP-binding protein
VALAGPEAADTNNLERGTVYAVETLGSETVFDVEIGGAIVRAVARTADLRQAPRRIGEAIAVRFDLASLYLFDAATGQTLVQPAPRLAA